MTVLLTVVGLFVYGGIPALGKSKKKGLEEEQFLGVPTSSSESG